MPSHQTRPDRPTSPLRWLTVMVAVLLLAVPAVTAAQSTPSAGTPASGTPAGTPLAGTPTATAGTNLTAGDVAWFIDPNSNARVQIDEWATSQPEDAAQLEKIAEQPVADWFGGWVPDIRAGVDARVAEITTAGALPILVAYDIPYRDCGQYSAGGQNDPESYRAWIADFAAGIGERPAVVILEPDGLTLTDCLDERQTTERFELLRFATETLEANPGTDVYIDAGHSDWLDPAEAARRLGEAGIDRAAGFALNTSNFQLTEDLIPYGVAISDAIGLGGTHFVLDTSRNGNGPWESDDPESWCNPPDRALGEAPTTETAHPLVDAYLWVKRVGESDGACRGGPDAGQWWPEYALGLAQRSDG